MLDENEREKILIREIPIQVYSKKMMLDGKNNEDYIREIPKQVYSMEKNEKEKFYIREI